MRRGNGSRFRHSHRRRQSPPFGMTNRTIHVGASRVRAGPIVEDDLLIAMELAEIIEEMGCTVVGPVGQLTRALAQADSSALDAALLELDLHGQSSEKVATLLSERGIPFAFVTAYSAALDTTVFDRRPVVRKPFHREDIQDVVRMLLPGRMPVQVSHR